MKSAIDKLLSRNVTEFVEQLETLSQQDKTLSDDLKFTIKILISFGKEATENQFELLQELKENLKIHRVLLRDIAGLFDYPPYPDLEEFSKQLHKNSLQLQSYIDSFDKDPKAGRDPKVNKGKVSQLTDEIIEEQFDISKLSRVVANIQNLGDGSVLSSSRQLNLVQQAVYINAIGRECPLNVKNRTYSNLTTLSRTQLRHLSDLFIERVNDPLLGAQERVKSQLNLIAVMREQYFRCTGVFLNSTQIVTVLLTLNQLQHNRCVELPPDENLNDTKAFLAALQWVFTQNNNKMGANEDLLVKDFKSTEAKDFFTFLGVPANDLNESEVEDLITEGVFKPEIVGLSKKVDVELAFRVPSHHRVPHPEPVSEHLIHSLDYLQKIHLAVNMAKSGQPIVLIAKNAEHAVALNKQLIEYFKSAGNSYEIKAFTGSEPAERRHQWFRDNAAKIPRIAVTVPYLANSDEFKSAHPNGCLAIQSYLHKSGETRKIIDRLSGFGTPSRFYAIHEENGIVSSLHSSLKSNQDKVNLLKAVHENRRSRNQEKAIEQYYIQSVTTIQRVILEQFDHWQEFLHLIHPRGEWKQLDSELFLVQQDLIKKLELQWKQILKESDPDRVYSNPYVRRTSSKELDTLTLDKALSDYETKVESIWTSTQRKLKEKTTGRLVPDSVNALRTVYLEQVKLSEQFKLNKIATRENIKITQHEQRKANRMVKSALDVNGAMLKYSEGNVRQYRQPFIQYQIRLLAKDIINNINHSSLSSNIKKALIDRANNAENLLSLELILIDYEGRWLSAEHHSEKYRMQPVINELLRVHQQSGAEMNPELETIKDIYLDNVVNDVVQKLEESLSWAKKENRGFWYLLERSAATRAADDLLLAIEGIKRSTDPLLQKSALKNLFKKLSQHQAQLEGLWLFSFGHKNIRDTINQTLNTLNELTVIGSGKDELDLGFINECKEEAHSEVVKQKFRTVLKQLEDRNSPWLKENKDWQEITQKLKVIQGENPSLYALDEMHHLVTLKCNELSQSKSKILDPIIHLRGTLRSLWNDVLQKHHDLLDESQHFTIKKEQIKKDLDGVAGFKTNQVELIVGSNGSTEYYDLIIRGSGKLPLLDNFTRYNSQITAMLNDQAQLKKQLELPLSKHSAFKQLRDEQLKLIKEGKAEQVNVALFPQTYQSDIKSILELQSYIAGTIPENITDFPEDIQNHFFDRALVNSMDFSQFLDKSVVDPTEVQRVLEHLGKIKDSQLRFDLIELYKKIHPDNVDPPKSRWSPKTWISGVASFITNPFKMVETEQDLRYQLSEFTSRPHNNLSQFLSEGIHKRMTRLTTGLGSQIDDEAKKIVSLHDKIQFISERIADEKNKGGVFIRRFASISQLYDFENNLRHYKAETPKLNEVDEVNPAEERFESDEVLDLEHEEFSPYRNQSEFKL